MKINLNVSNCTEVSERSESISKSIRKERLEFMKLKKISPKLASRH